MMGAHMERDMRQKLFDHYERLSFSYYDQNNSGQMMSKLVSDLFDISEFAHHGPENLFISVIKIVGSFTFLFLINWRLAIPLLVMVVFMLIFSYKQNRQMQETFMDNRRKIGDVNSSLQDTLAGIRVVQSFANEKIEREKFEKSNEGFLVSKDANYHCMGSFMSGNLFFQGMMYLITLVFGTWENGSCRSCHVCAIHRNFYQSDPDSCGAYRDDAERSFRFPALSGCCGDGAGDCKCTGCGAT